MEARRIRAGQVDVPPLDTRRRRRPDSVGTGGTSQALKIANGVPIGHTCPIGDGRLIGSVTMHVAAALTGVPAGTFVGGVWGKQFDIDQGGRFGSPSWPVPEAPVITGATHACLIGSTAQPRTSSAPHFAMR